MDKNAQEYGRIIAEKIFDFQQAFRDELNTDNPEYAELVDDGAARDTAFINLAEDKDFIQNYLMNELLDLGVALLKADWYGRYVAGDDCLLKYRTREEIQQKVQEKQADYYHDVNKTISGFFGKLEEWKNIDFMG